MLLEAYTQRGNDKIANNDSLKNVCNLHRCIIDADKSVTESVKV